MKCTACGHENLEDAAFCGGCGTSLARSSACLSCGRAVQAGERFCQGCGASLDARSAPTTPAPSPVPLPTSFAAGRYNVRSFLGEGAKKRVYLAHDTKLDRDVAFALIKTEGLDADGLVRVRREAQAMGRLGDHPHIVTIFDTGDEAGAPYIVSQYRGGGSVEDLLSKAEQHRIAPDSAMKIAEQVCHALQHAHGRGIVHRDLKPGNVWLDEDGNAALGDFGLAVVLDRSRMTMAGMMVGTVAYMAPEQALGRTPDARSDLYALGAMLYEMVTGRPPFLGDDAVGVISQHINTAPVAPSWHEPSVPKPLEALIVRLLAKSPDERPASALEVAHELRRIIERSTVEPPTPTQADGSSDLRGLSWGFFVGRREEMDGLKEALEGTLSGKGSLAMLVGEPGIGKTRLAEEFGVYAGLRGAQVLTGHCFEGESALPYRPFVEALRQYTRSRPDAELRPQLGPGAPEIATLVSEIRQRFPDIEEAPKLDPEAERLRLFESVTEFLHNASSAQPLVLHLDDLHWADKPSLLLLQHLAQRTARDRLLILGAYRDVELDRTHPLSEVLGALRRLPNYRRVLLRGLSQETVVDLLGVLEPSEEASAGRTALAAALYEETEGNPFFIREVIAHLIETGKIVHENGRWVGRVTSRSELGIPEGVREVIGRRLSHLGGGCNKMLTLASTMTGGFSWEALKAINASVPESELLDLLEEALAVQVVAERRNEPGTYDFTHALIRQTLYDELSTPRRVLLHRQIGEALERLYGSNVDAHLPELAHHFYQAAPGGDVDKAIDYAKRAGERAMKLAAWEEAVGAYERAVLATELQGSAKPDVLCEVLLALSDAQQSANAYQAAADTAMRAIESAREGSSAEPFARAVLAYAAAEIGALSSYDQARAQKCTTLLTEALARIAIAEPALRAQLLGAMAVAALLGLELDRAALVAREAVDLARHVEDGAQRARALRDAHFGLSSPDTLRERVDVARALVAAASAANDDFMLIQAHGLLAEDLLELGEIDRAADELQTLAGAADRRRSPMGFWGALASRAMLHYVRGAFADAERLMAEALREGQKSQSDLPLTMFGAQLLSLRFLQGRMAELEALVKLQFERLPEAVALNNAVLALVYVETGRLPLAREPFDVTAADGFATVPRDAAWLVTINVATDVCTELGDVVRAQQLYDLLLPYADQNITIPVCVVCTGSASRQLGMMASLMERWDDAQRHFDDALAFNQQMNASPWVAHTQYQYAKMLVARDAPGDKARALGLLQAALETAEALGMAKIIERGLALKLEAQGLTSSDVYASIDAVAHAVERERPEISVHPAPDGTVTIMFSDIADSTPLTERLGDQAWQDLLRKHNAIIRAQLKTHDGYEVKTMGDGFMVAFQSAKKGLDCAIAIQRAFDGHNAAAGEHVKVRIGLHAGEAIKDGDDFYGKNVILASRVAGKAVGGEILVSSLLRQLVESSVDAGTFADAREVELKGLSGSHTVYAVAVR